MIGIVIMTTLPSRSTIRRASYCANESFPKRMVWTQLMLCPIYRDTVLSLDGTTVAANTSNNSICNSKNNDNNYDNGDSNNNDDEDENDNEDGYSYAVH